MMTGIIVRAWKSVKPHIPLIKFRKGGTSGGQSVSEQSAAHVSEGSKGAASSLRTSSLPVIEDWQLPPKYRRQMLDDKEINMINSGGAY